MIRIRPATIVVDILLQIRILLESRDIPDPDPPPPPGSTTTTKQQISIEHRRAAESLQHVFHLKHMFFRTIFNYSTNPIFKYKLRKMFEEGLMI